MTLQNKMFVVKTYSDAYSDVVSGQYYYDIAEKFDDNTGEPFYEVYPTRWVEEINNELIPDGRRVIQQWVREEHPVVTSTPETVTYLVNQSKASYDAPQVRTFAIADQAPNTMEECIVHAFNLYAQDLFSFGTYQSFLEAKAELADRKIMELTSIADVEVVFEPEVVFLNADWGHSEPNLTQMRIMPMPVQAEIDGIEIKNLTPEIADFDFESRFVKFKRLGTAKFHITSTLGHINKTVEVVCSTEPEDEPTYSVPEKCNVGTSVSLYPTYSPPTATFVGQEVHILVGLDICTYDPKTHQLHLTGTGQVQGDVFDNLTGGAYSFHIYVEDPNYIPIESIEIPDVIVKGYGIRHAAKMEIKVTPENATNKDDLLIFPVTGAKYDPVTKEACLVHANPFVSNASADIMVLDMTEGVSATGHVILDGVPLQQIRIADMGVPRNRHVPLTIEYVPADAVKPEIMGVGQNFEIDAENQTITYKGQYTSVGWRIMVDSLIFEDEQKPVFSAQISDNHGDNKYAFDAIMPDTIEVVKGQTITMPITYTPADASHLGGMMTGIQAKYIEFNGGDFTLKGVESTPTPVNLVYKANNTGKALRTAVTVREDVTSLEFVDPVTTVEEKEDITLSVRVVPETSTSAITFTSSDPTIATVGYHADAHTTHVIGVKEGQATITAKAAWGGVIATQTVKVLPKLKDFTIGSGSATMVGDTTITANIALTPANGVVDGYYVSYKDGANQYLKASVENNVLTVTSRDTATLTEPKDLVVAVQPTNTTMERWFRVRLEPEPKAKVPTSITLDKSEVTVYMRENGEQKVTATVLPEDAEDKSVTWTLSGDTQGISTSSPTANPLAFYTFENCAIKYDRELTLTATTSNGLTASCVVKQPYVPIQSVKMVCESYDENAYVSQGESKVIFAEYSPKTASFPIFNFTSSNPNHVSLSQYSDNAYEVIANVLEGGEYGWSVITATSAENSAIKGTMGVETTPLDG